MKTITIEIPDGKKAEWVNGVLTLVDDKPQDPNEKIPTFADAKECGYRIDNKNPEQDGNEVTYEDGYKSWSPKTSFDKAYKPISPTNSAIDEYIKLVLRNFIKTDKDFEIFTVWKCKVLQNTKWLMCTDLPDNKYYELTYNGDKRELYIDECVKRNIL